MKTEEKDEDYHRNRGHSLKLCTVFRVYPHDYGVSKALRVTVGKAVLETDLALSYLTPPRPESAERSRATPSFPSYPLKSRLPAASRPCQEQKDITTSPRDA